MIPAFLGTERVQMNKLTLRECIKNKEMRYGENWVRQQKRRRQVSVVDRQLKLVICPQSHQTDNTYPKLCNFKNMNQKSLLESVSVVVCGNRVSEVLGQMTSNCNQLLEQCGSKFFLNMAIGVAKIHLDLGYANADQVLGVPN